MASPQTSDDFPRFDPPPRLADPHGMPTKHMHVTFNPWELEQLAVLSRRECVPMTKLVRRIVRERLFAGQKR